MLNIGTRINKQASFPDTGNMCIYSYQKSSQEVKCSNCDLKLDPVIMKDKPIKDIVILNSCMTLYQNRSINDGAKVMTMCFLIYSNNCDLDILYRMLECNLVKVVVILNICVTLNQNRPLKE